MRVLFVTTSAFLPQRVAGAEVSTHSLAIALKKRGFQVGVLAGLRAGDWLWFRNRIASKLCGGEVYTMDKFCGYPVFRGWAEISAIPAVIGRFEPDIVLLESCPLRSYSDLFVGHGLPVIASIRDATFYGGNLIAHPSIRYIANSGFIAGRLLSDFGIEGDVIPPPVFLEKYRILSTRERVLFVNPVAKKGIEIALRLAEERPDIPFDFVECWERNSELRHTERVRRSKNIRWHKSRLDVRRSSMAVRGCF